MDPERSILPWMAIEVGYFSQPVALGRRKRARFSKECLVDDENCLFVWWSTGCTGNEIAGTNR